jgi:hypothetical protein
MEGRVIARGSLALRSGVLYVARHEIEAQVRPYDLDGHALGHGFPLRGAEGERCELGGIDVDSDHQVWLADAANARLRSFTLFGRVSRSLSGDPSSGEGLRRDDVRGSLRALTDVAVRESEDDLQLVVASGGWRRHAVQVFRDDGRCLVSLRPEGDPLAHFHGAVRVAARGRWTYVCETLAGRVQVFRDDEFHFAFRLPVRHGGRFEPLALAPLEGGRMVIATGGADGALLLVDGAGRLIRVLAERGEEHGRVRDVGDVVAADGASERETRIAVIDRDSERVQVFTLEGLCHGELRSLPGQAVGGAE